MELTTPCLTLRPVDMSYLHSTHVYASDLENTKFMMFLPYESLEETAQIIQEAQNEWQKPQPATYHFVILLDGVHIGQIILFMQEDRSVAELAWLLNKNYWRKGYISEAARAIVEFGWNSIGLHCILGACDSENIPSRCAMEKLGMQLVDEGTPKTVPWAMKSAVSSYTN